MQFDRSVNQYLSGDRFSSALLVRLIGENAAESDRVEFLSNLSAGKNILHVGFADHLDLLSAKFAENQWLHAILRTSAARCAGIDVDRKAVEFCAEHLEIDDIYVNDIMRDEPIGPILEESWDYAVFGEVLEHVSNPGAFLIAFREKYGSCVQRIVITVPNAWSLGNFLSALRMTEFINSDHRFWFTPYTLAKIAADAEFSPEHVYYTGRPHSDGWVRRWIRSRYPGLRETLIGVFTCH